MRLKEAPHISILSFPGGMYMMRTSASIGCFVPSHIGLCHPASVELHMP